MPRNARQVQTRVDAGDRGGIGMTDSTGFYPNPNLTRSRLGDWPFHYSKRAGCGDFHCFVCVSHLYVPLNCILFWIITYNPLWEFDSRNRDLAAVFLGAPMGQRNKAMGTPAE
jgi:hypothetical protein